MEILAITTSWLRGRRQRLTTGSRPSTFTQATCGVPLLGRQPWLGLYARRCRWPSVACPNGRLLSFRTSGYEDYRDSDGVIGPAGARVPGRERRAVFFGGKGYQ